MMRLLVVVILSSISLLSYANESQFKTDAKLRVRYSYSEKEDKAYSQWQHRALLNFNYRSGEKYELKTKLLHKALWGYGTEELDYDLGTVDEPGTALGYRADDNMLFVKEAYISWLAQDDIQLKLGRQALNFGTGLVISSNDYFQMPNSFDAAGVLYDTNFALVSFYWIQAADVDSENGEGADPERNIYTIVVDIKSLPTLLSKAHIHFVKDAAQQFSAPNEPKRNVTRYGLQIQGTTKGVLYGFDIVSESGSEFTTETTDVATSMAQLTLGYQFQSFWKFLIEASYHVDSGDADSDSTDSTRKMYDGYFYDEHKYAGRVDALQFGNLTYSSLRLEVEPREKMKAGIELFLFNKTEESDVRVNFLGETLGETVATEVSGSKLGNEFDFYYKQSFLNGLEFSMHASVFVPSNSDLPISEDLRKVSLQTKWTF